jgi:hypothetical protein
MRHHRPSIATVIRTLLFAITLVISVHIFVFSVKVSIVHSGLNQTEPDPVFHVSDSDSNPTEPDPVFHVSDSDSNPTEPDPVFHISNSSPCSFQCNCQFIRNPTNISCTVQHGEIESVYSMPSWSDYVCPQSFRNIADYVYSYWFWYDSESIFLPDLEKVVDCLPTNAIIYLGWGEMGAFETFFAKMVPLLKRPIILVSGNSDYLTPEKHISHVQNNDSMILHWFGANGKDVPPGTRFTRIPIGNQCSRTTNAIEELKNRNHEDTKYHEKDPYRKFPLKPVEGNTRKWAILNFNPATNSISRETLWNTACDPEMEHNWLTFADCRRDRGDYDIVEALEKNLEYPFWISPYGSGYDCFRTWEALRLGRIPVLLSTFLDPIYEDLPVVIVPSYDIVNEEFLRTKFDEITRKRLEDGFHWDKLYMDYWERLILSKAGKRPEDRRGPRCWRPQQPAWERNLSL